MYFGCFGVDVSVVRCAETSSVVNGEDCVFEMFVLHDDMNCNSSDVQSHTGISFSVSDLTSGTSLIFDTSIRSCCLCVSIILWSVFVDVQSAVGTNSVHVSDVDALSQKCDKDCCDVSVAEMHDVVVEMK